MKPDYSQSPYKFLDSFTHEDSELFFGRDHEVEELYSKVFQSQLVLIYGASGTGKSSIVNCGLANRFRASDWLPINIRRGGDIVRSMYNQIAKETVHTTNLPHKDSLDAEDFRKLIGSVFLDHFKPIYLIFDQFEELFIFGMQEEWKRFISLVRHLVDSDLDVHFLFVIRGEYLEYLSIFEEEIPDFFDNRVRIEKMTRKNAEQIISGPARMYSIQLDEGFENNLIKKISPDKAHVELTFLQVFLDRIYKKALEKFNNEGPVVFSNEFIENIGQVGDVLAEFVDEQLFKMDDPKAALTVLKTFVSLKGTKVQRTAQNIKDQSELMGQPLDLNTIEKILIELVNRRILKEKDDNDYYELRHDSLAQKIYDKITIQERELLDVQQFILYSYNEYVKRGILLKDEDITYISPFERLLKLDQNTKEFLELSKKKSLKQKKSRRIRSIIISLIVLLSISSAAGFIYSQIQRNKAEELALIANRESEEAQRQRSIAEEQQALALEQEQTAKEQALIASTEKEKADLARIEATNQKNEALFQKQDADKQRQLAEQAKLAADRNARDALASKDIAEQERQKARVLRMLGLVRELSIKSTFLADRELKALLALNALKFNQDYKGSTFNADLYQALYSASMSFDMQHAIKTRHHSQTITGIVSTGESAFTCGHDGKLIRFDARSGTANPATLISSSDVFEHMAISPNGKVLALGSQSGSVILVDPIQSKIIVEKSDRSSPVIHIENGIRDGFMVVFEDGTVTELSFSGEVSNTKSLSRNLVGAAINKANGDLWIVTLQGEVLRNTASGSELIVQSNGSARIQKLAIMPSGEKIALGYSNGMIGVYHTDLKQITENLMGHDAAITDLAFNQHGKFLASASYDRSARIWNLDQLQDQPIVLSNHDNWISSISFLDNTKLVTGTYSGQISIYPLNYTAFAQGLCTKIGRDLSTTEWEEYIGNDIAQIKLCTHD